MRPVDPFVWCRRHGVDVVRIAGARRWLTGQWLGRPFVVVNPRLTATEQRLALVKALLAHPTLTPVAAR